MAYTHFFNSFTALYRPYVKLIQPILDDYNLHTAQWLVLKDIAINQPTTLVQISKRRSIEKPTTRKIIKVLLDKGLLSLAQGEDKREKWLTLSPAGQKQHDAILAQVIATQNNIIDQSGLSETEITTITQNLEHIYDLLIKEVNQ